MNPGGLVELKPGHQRHVRWNGQHIQPHSVPRGCTVRPVRGLSEYIAQHTAMRWDTTDTGEPMISSEKRYEFITSQIQHADDMINGTFALYIKLTVAIAGGVAWLSTIDQKPTIPFDTLRMTANFLLTLVATGCSSMICFHARARYGYRKAESTLVPEVRSPSARTCTNEVVMLLAIILTTLLLVFWNPLSTFSFPENGGK